MPANQTPTKSVLLRQVNAFNARHPLGTPVIVSTPAGDVKTYIRNAAFVRDGGMCVACVAAAPYYVTLDRVRPEE